MNDNLDGNNNPNWNGSNLDRTGPDRPIDFTLALPFGFAFRV